MTTIMTPEYIFDKQLGYIKKDTLSAAAKIVGISNQAKKLAREDFAPVEFTEKQAQITQAADMLVAQMLDFAQLVASK